MNDPLGRTVLETGSKLITTLSKYNDNKYNMYSILKDIEKVQRNSIIKEQNGLEQSKN